MKLTATQRLLAGLAVKLNLDQLDVLKNLCTLPEGVKASIATPIKFLTVLRQQCVTVEEFVLKLEELLSTGSSFNDLQTFGRLLYAQCGENDLSTRATHFPMGMVNYRPTRRQSMSFNSTLLKISENIRPDAVEIMRTVTPIPDATKEHVRNGHNLFSKMKDCGCISENDTEFLEDLLREMKLIRALEILEQYKQSYPPVLYPPFVPRQPTSNSAMPAHGSQPQGNRGVARMVSMPEEGASSQQLVLGRNYARTTSGNYPSSMSGGNFSSMPTEGSNSVLGGGSSATMSSGNSSSLSSGDLNSFHGNLGSGYPSLDDRSLLPSMAPLSSNRLPPRGPPSDSSSCNDFRTAPCSPAVASPPIQSRNPMHFNRSVSFGSPSLGSSVFQRPASSPHTPSATVHVPLDVTPHPTHSAQPGGDCGGEELNRSPNPSAPSLQVVESLERPPPTNPHFTPHAGRGFPPSAGPHDPRNPRSMGSSIPPASGGAVLPSPHPGVSSGATNSNLNSNVSSHHSTPPSGVPSLGPGRTPPEGSTTVPQQRQDTGLHELVPGAHSPPVSLPGVFTLQSAPRRTSSRLAASRTSLPEQTASQSHRTSRPRTGPRETLSSSSVYPQPQPRLQSIPSHTLSQGSSEPNTASYGTGTSDSSYPGVMEGVFIPPSSVQDVRPNPRVSEIGQSEASTPPSLPSYPADFEHQFSVPVENSHPGIGGAGASNGYHQYQNGTAHGHGNRPQPPLLHLNPHFTRLESVDVKRQARNSESFGSIPAPVPIRQSPGKAHRPESGGSATQCSEPSSPTKQLYPALPVTSSRKRKGELNKPASGATPSKRSKTQASEERLEETSLLTNKPGGKGVSASKPGLLKRAWKFVMGGEQSDAQSEGQSGSQNESGQEQSLEEEKDEDYHSCNGD